MADAEWCSDLRRLLEVMEDDMGCEMRVSSSVVTKDLHLEDSGFDWNGRRLGGGDV